MRYLKNLNSNNLSSVNIIIPIVYKNKHEEDE